MTFTPSKLRQALLAWYDSNRRDLPWRTSKDPYRIWVSEIMLQQTRVDAVTPYYQRWLATFPDVDSLASADVQDVLKQWEGLGYYSRARNLHNAARLVRERHNGAIPNTYESLRELPGIGEYTAGAIASIAYNINRPAVDGNVRRVLSRLLDLPAPAAKVVREAVTEIVDPERPGDFNQALMELGATVCKPRKPACDECPVRHICKALANGTVLERPGSPRRKPIPHERVNTVVCIQNEHVLLRRRPEKGLLAGLWEFPERADLPEGARSLGEVSHLFSHKRITYHAVLSASPEIQRAGEQWVPLAHLARYPLSTAQRRIELLMRAVFVP